MVIETRKFKRKKLPKELKDAYQQLHVLEIEASRLLCSDPVNGTVTGNYPYVDTETLQEHLNKMIEKKPTDVYVTPYGLDGKDMLIDFRGCLTSRKCGCKTDTMEHFPKLPGAIAGAMAYAASIGFTAIAVMQDEGPEGTTEDLYPGITVFLEKGIKEHGLNLEITEDTD